MKVLAKFVGAWSVVALTMKAAVYVPCGLVLLAVAARLVWIWADSIVADVVAAWIAYHGGRLVFGSLEGFVIPPQHKNPAAPEVPQRSGQQPRADRRSPRRQPSR
jgi:hypothetical protein